MRSPVLLTPPLLRWLCVLSLAAIFAASQTRAADPAEYVAPKWGYSMQAHFAWCGEAKTPVARLKRYEKFWEMQGPDPKWGYDDAVHIRTARRCAYRLVQLYAETGRIKDCVRMLKWLEKEDDRFAEERSPE